MAAGIGSDARIARTSSVAFLRSARVGGLPRLLGQPADALDQIQQLLTLLPDQGLPEQAADPADVGPQVGVAIRGRARRCPVPGRRAGLEVRRTSAPFWSVLRYAVSVMG